jgi:regulator of sigma E protease
MTPQEDGSESSVRNGFYSRPPWQRILVLFAGPLFSVLAGYILLIPLYAVKGIEVPDPTPVIGVLFKGPAQQAGLDAGDLIVSLDDQKIGTFFEATRHFRDRAGQPSQVEFERKGVRKTVSVIPKPTEKPAPVMGADMEPTGEYRVQGKVGIAPRSITKPLTFGEAVVRTTNLPFRMLEGLGRLVAAPERIQEETGGVVTIFMSTTGAFELGFIYLLELCGLLTISIGVFNLLPIGPLDGGQMFLAMIEMLRGGRRLSFKVQYAVLGTGTFVLFALILAITFFDIERWFVKPPTVPEVVRTSDSKPE